MSINRLQKLIIEKKNPTVAGLDPRPEYIPPQIFNKHLREKGETLEAAADAYCEFCCGLIDALHEIVPAVKPQSAYFEMLGFHGVRAMGQIIDYARKKGLYVIIDAKRNDIGSTAAAYSEAYLGTVKIGETEYAPFDGDGVTVNAYLGSDGIDPFLEMCRTRDKSIFALVKTSNPSSSQLQDLLVGDRNLYTAVGDLIARLSKDTIGEYGYAQAGAVVGATYPSDLKKLRRRLENTFFLVPGYGAQGGRAEDVACAFDRFGRGAVINSSRAILCAWQKHPDGGEAYQTAAREAAVKMRDDLKQVVTIV